MNNPIDKVNSRLVPASVSVHDFLPRADLTYKLIDGLTIKEVDVTQSLFSGAIVRKCCFEKVVFRRCDMDGARIEDCRFYRCDFTNAELRAAQLSRVRFVDCNLESVSLKDTTARDIEFSDCNFSLMTASESSFVNSQFSRCDLHGSGVTHARFDNCSFDSVIFGDCTFLYNVMVRSEFANCGINIESLGMIYGISESAIASMKLLYLGQELASSTARDAKSLQEFYVRHSWHFGAAIIAVSTRNAAVLFGIRQCLQSIANHYASGHALSIDELRFLGQLLTELEGESRLPIQSCLDILGLARSIIDSIGDFSQAAMGRDLIALRECAATAHLLMIGMAERIDSLVSADALLSEGTTHLKLVFEHRPEVICNHLLEEIAAELGDKGNVLVLNEWEGSYEILLVAPAKVAMSFLLLLYIINGIMVQITLLRGRIQTLMKRQLPRQYRELVQSTANPIPDILREPMRKMLGMIPKMKWLEKPDLGGLSETNIRSIEVSSQPKQPLASTTSD